MPNPKQELIEREHAWIEAIQRRDFDALELILAPEYAYTASNQGRWSRQRWLETLPVYNIDRFTFKEIEVRLYGEVAVVLSDYHQDASVNGEPRSGDFLLTDVWVKRDGRWQVTVRSSILMPAETPA